VRIQPLTHDVERDEAEKGVRDIAVALGAQIVDWSHLADEQLVREAFETPEPEPPVTQPTAPRLRAPRQG
jgi:hypothetical protein